VHSDLLNAAQMTPQLYSAGEETLKIIFAYVPVLAEFECRQFSPTSHTFDFLATAFEDFRNVANVQHFRDGVGHSSCLGFYLTCISVIRTVGWHHWILSTAICIAT
jgi:hypothetical protein